MKASNRKKNGNQDQSPYFDFSKIKKADINELSKLSLPLSLNDYYKPFIENIKDCLLFLERFAEDDETIERLLKVYNSDKAFSKTSDSLDLDLLAKKADLSRGELRRLLNSTLDVLGDEEAVMLLRMNKKHLVRKSLEVALTDAHPDSYEERKSLMQYYGYHPIPKGSQVSINIDKSQNLNAQQNIVNNNLPSFASTIAEGQKIGSQQVKSMIDDSLDMEEEPKKEIKLIESQPISISIPTYSDKSPFEIKAELVDEDKIEED